MADSKSRMAYSVLHIAYRKAWSATRDRVAVKLLQLRRLKSRQQEREACLRRLKPLHKESAEADFAPFVGAVSNRQPQVCKTLTGTQRNLL
jgi:hypothetical protein